MFYTNIFHILEWLHYIYNTYLIRLGTPLLLNDHFTAILNTYLSLYSVISWNIIIIIIIKKWILKVNI